MNNNQPKEEEIFIDLTKDSPPSSPKHRKKRKISVIDLTDDTPSTPKTKTTNNPNTINTTASPNKSNTPSNKSYKKKPISHDVIEIKSPNKLRKQETPKNKRKCTICLEEMKEISATFCGHCFCTNCIREWLKCNHKCPICRKKCSFKQVHRIFLDV